MWVSVNEPNIQYHWYAPLNHFQVILPCYYMAYKIKVNNLTLLATSQSWLYNVYSLSLSLTLQIETLPPELFQCKKLRTLNLGNNCLQTLPSRFGELTGLTQLELRGNRLECLPVELGECRLLKRSGLVVEEDLFNTLPSEVKEQLWRADKEQAWGQPQWRAAGSEKKEARINFGAGRGTVVKNREWELLEVYRNVGRVSWEKAWWLVGWCLGICWLGLLNSRPAGWPTMNFYQAWR